MTWKDLTIHDYNRINELLLNATDEITMSEAQEQILVEIANYTHDELQRMHIARFVKLFDEEFGFLNGEMPVSKPVKIFRAGWGIYKIEYDISKLTKGQYDEVVAFSSKDGIKNMHLYLASVSKPVWWWPFGYKDHGKRAKQIEYAPFLTGYFMSVFFYQLYKDLLTNILTSLEGRTLTKEEKLTILNFLPTSDSSIITNS